MQELNLGTEKFEIKKYASFGMISFTEHSKERMRERGFSPIQIYEYLTEKNTTIVQYKEPNSYNNNYPRYVMYGKINKNPLHIVIEKKITHGIKQFEIVTVYEPSKKNFSHNGRYVKPARCRK